MIDVVEQVIERHPEVKNEGIPEHHTSFSINIYNAHPRESPKFDTIFNILNPLLIDESYGHSGKGIVEGIKLDDGRWNLSGHRNRIISIGEEELSLITQVFETQDSRSLECCLPPIHSMETLAVLKELASHHRNIHEVEKLSTVLFHETYAQNDGLISRSTKFPERARTAVLSGPHFFVANPLYKTPRSVCELNSDYNTIDLNDISEEYIPRTNYVANDFNPNFLSSIPSLPWDTSKKAYDAYRIINREMTSPSLERTLVCSIIPPEFTHINTCMTTAFSCTGDLLDVASTCATIISDFRVKVTGANHVNQSIFYTLPIIRQNNPYRLLMHCHILRLNCVTSLFSGLWEEAWDPSFKDFLWTKIDKRLQNGNFKILSQGWAGKYALRTDYERRQALLECDVLCAMEFGLSLEDLKGIYRTSQTSPHF